MWGTDCVNDILQQQQHITLYPGFINKNPETFNRFLCIPLMKYPWVLNKTVGKPWEKVKLVIIKIS